MYAALECLVIFVPGRYPVLDLRRLRGDFLRSEPAFTQLNFLDAQVAMVEQQAQLLRRNERRLRRALVGLGMAIGLLATGTLAATIGG